jgi:general stress protein 26
MANEESAGSGTEQFKKIHELIKDIRVAMLMTEGSDGKLHSRPMATQEAEFDGNIWFLSRQSSGKVTDIQHQAQVNLAYSDGKHTFVTLSGKAEIQKDREKIDELWNPLYKAWFPEGKDDPEVTVIKVQVEDAEYWEAPANAIVRNVKMLSAAITGGNVSVGEHDKVSL